MQPFRGPPMGNGAPPPRGFPGQAQAPPGNPPIVGMGVPSMRPPPPPPMMVGGMMPPRGPMMFVPAPRGPPHLAAMRGPMMMAMPGGVSAPPPPGTVDVPVPVVDLRETGPMNVFVGKLPPDLHDNYIRQLLEKCGTVVTWKRTTDPVTGKPKGFGYCTYSTASDVLRALRLLNGFSVDSKEMLLKVDAKTQAKLDAFTKTMTEKVKLEEQEKDTEIKQILKTLFEDRSGLMGGHQNDVASWGKLLEGKTSGGEDERHQQQQQQQQNAAQVAGEADAASTRGDRDSGNSGSTEAPVRGEKVRGKMIMSEIEKFRLAQEQREQELEKKRREVVLERLRKEKEEEERRKAAEERRKAAEEKRRAAEEAARVAREEKEKNMEEGEMEDEDEKVSDEDGKSRSRRRDRGRDRDRKKRSARERDRSRDRDRKRRARSRSHSRERSRRHRRRRSRSRSRSRTRSRSRSRHRDRERRKRRHRRDSSDGDRSDGESRPKRRRRDSKADDTDTKDDKKVDESSETPETPDATPKAMPKVVLGLKMQSAASKKEKPAAVSNVSVFTVEEEVEAKPVREIVPIDYTEEEKLAGASVQQRVAATVARINSRSGDAKSVIDQIPTETAELFAYPIDWKAVDTHKLVADKMASWVTKKIVEYLGEEEPTMIEFILKKLDQHAKADEILDELQLVLDDDAEVFVKLLWRKLAFEAIRSEQQLT